MATRSWGERSFPLSEESFRRALHAGHGRAKLHLERHGFTEFRQIVLEAATKCPCYDPQVEGLPADWFADICESAHIVESFLELKPGQRRWDHAWRFALLREFGARGHSRARELLYWSLFESEKGELFGAEELVKLEGEPGLLFVARRLGQILHARDNLAVDRGPILEFDSKRGAGAALRVLQAAAASDPDVATYAEHLARPSEEKPPRRHEVPSASETLREILDAQAVLPGLRYRARKYRAEELAPIRELALTTQSPVILENCLRCLAGCRSLPFDAAFLPFARHPEAPVRLFAAQALGQHQNAAVRAAGRELLSVHLETAVVLLAQNATAADLDFVVASLKPEADPHLQHSIVTGLLDLMGSSPAMSDPRLAWYVYEQAPCQLCRESALEILLASPQCPAWLPQEASRDASGSIRSMLAKRCGN